MRNQRAPKTVRHQDRWRAAGVDVSLECIEPLDQVRLVPIALLDAVASRNLLLPD